MGELSLRRSEWVLIAFFLYAAVIAWFLPVRTEIALLTSGLNASVVASFFLTAHAHALRGRRLFTILRDWYPMPLLLLAYRELGWFAPAHRTYEVEKTWVVWDRFFLHSMGVKGLIESLGPILPSMLELSYTLVYTVPYFSLGVLYATGHRKRTDRFLFPFTFAVLAAYVLGPFFLSEPPRTVFPGEDFPSMMTVFRRFNWGFLGAYGIHTSVFPSAHCSGSFSAALAMTLALPEKKWVGRFLLVLAVLIATATVYGRYHYLADAVAGWGLALTAIAVMLAADRRGGLRLGFGGLRRR